MSYYAKHNLCSNLSGSSTLFCGLSIIKLNAAKFGDEICTVTRQQISQNLQHSLVYTSPILPVLHLITIPLNALLETVMACLVPRSAVRVAVSQSTRRFASSASAAAASNLPNRVKDAISVRLNHDIRVAMQANMSIARGFASHS